jgi:uncharacterized protein DUF4349
VKSGRPEATNHHRYGEVKTRLTIGASVEFASRWLAAQPPFVDAADIADAMPATPAPHAPCLCLRERLVSDCLRHFDGGKPMMSRTAWWPLRATALLLLVLGGCAPAPQALVQGGYSVDPSATVPFRQGFAVQHRFTLMAPNADIEALQQKHIAECVKLGCSILNTSINRPDGRPINAHLSVRIAPQAYDAFATVLAAAPAKVTFHSEVADELTAPTLDTEKRLATKTALRERLTKLLNDRNTQTAADLIAIEKELSQTQTEIEALTAQLDNLHQRTDTMSVDISYTGEVGRYGVDLTPLREAAHGIGETVVRSLAALIYCLAAMAPWLPVIALLWWLIRRGLRRWRTKSV